MDNSLRFWLIVGVLGVCTLGIRASFILMTGKLSGNEACLNLLRFIPVSVFAALSVPALIFARSGSYDFQGNERLLAGFVAILVAWYSKSILATIGSGMLVLWLLKWMI